MTDPAIIRALIDGWLNVAVQAEADAKHSEACGFTVMAERNWKTHQHAMLQADALEQVLTRRKGDEA